MLTLENHWTLEQIQAALKNVELLSGHQLLKTSHAFRQNIDTLSGKFEGRGLTPDLRDNFDVEHEGPSGFIPT